MRKIIFSIGVMLIGYFVSAQEIPNFAGSGLSANSSKANEVGGMAVNYFTGLPQISVPIYQYKSSSSGIGLDISLSYAATGIRAGEAATTVGLGWSLNAGGCITRKVRGMPDDVPTYGYLYAATVLTDFRDSALKYYYDSLDTQPDEFQFSCPGGSGKFYLGKNGAIVTVPSSKIKIIPFFQEASIFYQTLKSFRIITEDGTKYDFTAAEYASVGVNYVYYNNASIPIGYANKAHATAWYLTEIISAFNTDTIRINYQGNNPNMTGYKFPQIAYFNGSTISTPSIPEGTKIQSEQRIQSIDFPNNTHVSFVYSLEYKNTDESYAISKIKISDTILRFGYLLGYDTAQLLAGGGWHGGAGGMGETRLMLKTVTPFTSKEKQEGYKFDYYGYLPKLGTAGDTTANMRDYWGFLNGIYNGQNQIPNVAGYTGGADRQTTIVALDGTLMVH